MTKHFKFIDYALSSLLRRRYKSFAILVAYSFTVATLASVLFLTNSLREETRYLLQAVPDLVVQRTLGGRHRLIPLEYIEEIKNIIGVSSVTPHYWGYTYDAPTKANFTLTGTDGQTTPVQLLEGRLPTAPYECAIGKGVAALKEVSVTEELILVNGSDIAEIYAITGVFQTDSNLLTNDLVILTNEAVAQFFHFPKDVATDLAVFVPNSSEVQTVAAKIKKIFPDSRPITKRELIRTYDMVFNWRSGMMLTVFSAAIVALCILAWDKATGISAEEKEEIGILKAIGWDTSDVLALKFWEGLIISLISLLTGIIFSYIHVFFFDGFVLAAVIKGWSVLFPTFQLTPGINVFHMLTMGFFTVVPYVASTVLPTWKTAVTDPDSVMRG